MTDANARKLAKDGWTIVEDDGFLNLVGRSGIARTMRRANTPSSRRPSTRTGAVSFRADCS